jgi:hypothetical protein
LLSVIYLLYFYNRPLKKAVCAEQVAKWVEEKM